MGLIFPMGSIKATQYLLFSSRKEHKHMTGKEQFCLPQPLASQTGWQEKHMPTCLTQLCCKLRVFAEYMGGHFSSYLFMYTQQREGT